MIRANANATLTAVVAWAATRADILALLLVGSYARQAPGPSSDLDLVLVSSEPGRYLAETAWVARFGAVRQQAREDWGMVQSLRVTYLDGLQVEFGVTSRGWLAAIPGDPATTSVVRDGVCILFDRLGDAAAALAQLAALDTASVATDDAMHE